MKNGTAAQTVLQKILAHYVGYLRASRSLGNACRQLWLRSGEAAPQAQPSYLAVVAEHTSDLIAVIDDRGRYRYISASHTRTLGHTVEAMVGRPCRDFIHPDDQGLAYERWQEARANGSACLACRLARHDGTWCCVDAQLDRIAHEGEHLTLVVGRDITDQQELERRLLQAQRTLILGTLASSIAHDINNVLAMITGSASLAADTLPCDHPSQEDLASILTACRHGSDLTHRLLGFVRQQPASASPINLGRVVMDLFPLIERLCRGRVTVTAETAPDLWPVAADRSQIEQVLMNLTVNARDAMPNGGLLTLRAHNHGEAQVRLEVIDTGEGMSAEVLARAFEPFYTTKAPGKGTGLGLFTSRCIIEELGGTIDADSAPGAGTRFEITLPRADLSAAAPCG